MAYVNLIDLVYPVGSFYISNSSTSPQTRFGGSWTQITNAVLRAYNGTGYAGSDTHAITVNEMPSHKHALTWNLAEYGSGNSQTHTSDWNVPSSSRQYTESTGGGKQCPYFLADITATFGTEQLNLFGGEL